MIDIIVCNYSLLKDNDNLTVFNDILIHFFNNILCHNFVDK